MASAPRRWSRELPPHLSELMDELIKYANSFIQGFDNSENRMREIVREFQWIVDDVRKMQKNTDRTRTAGAVTGGAALGLGSTFAPLTGGLSLAAGAAAAAGGGVTVVSANLTKTWTERGHAKKVEELGKEFLRIVEPVKKKLDEIKTTCKKLEENSSEVQAEKILTEMHEFKMILRQVSALRDMSEGVLDVVVTGISIIDGLLKLFVAVFRFTLTPEQDEKLRSSIICSGEQCEKITDELGKMKEKLRDFTGH